MAETAIPTGPSVAPPNIAAPAVIKPPAVPRIVPKVLPPPALAGAPWYTAPLIGLGPRTRGGASNTIPLGNALGIGIAGPNLGLNLRFDSACKLAPYSLC